MEFLNGYKKSNFISTYAIVIFSAFISFSCSPETASVDTGSKKSSAPADANVSQTTDDDVIDFEKTCGIKATPAEGEDPDKVLFTLSMKSLPINITGAQMGVKFNVVLDGGIEVESKAKSGAKTAINLKVLSAKTTATGIIGAIANGIAKSKAEASAKKLSAPTKSESLPMGQWLNLVTEGGQFKDLLCGIAPATIKQTATVNGKDSVNEFSPGLPATISPLAPRETLEKEIGSGRDFKVTSKVISAEEGGMPVGEYPTTVKIRPVEPTFTAADGKTYAGDLAYEIAVVTPPPSGFKGLNKLSNTRVYYLNTKEHTFEALRDTSQNTSDGIKTPIIEFIRQ